jgi:hypothetical protein
MISDVLLLVRSLILISFFLFSFFTGKDILFLFFFFSFYRLTVEELKTFFSLFFLFSTHPPALAPEKLVRDSNQKKDDGLA